jgi:hypothetical protein
MPAKAKYAGLRGSLAELQCEVNFIVTIETDFGGSGRKNSSGRIPFVTATTSAFLPYFQEFVEEGEKGGSMSVQRGLLIG